MSITWMPLPSKGTRSRRTRNYDRLVPGSSQRVAVIARAQQRQDWRMPINLREEYLQIQNGLKFRYSNAKRLGSKRILIVQGLSNLASIKL